MTRNLVFTLCVPDDFEWTDKLVKRLMANEYNVYLEPPDEQNELQTTSALKQARLMLVVISQESALGDSAEVFEDWWRPFAEQSKSIITVVKSGQPAGVEHWMPFNLRRFPRVNFDNDQAYTKLTKELENILSPNSMQIPDAVPALPPPSPGYRTPPAKPSAPPKPVVAYPEPPPMPPARASYAMEQAHNRRRERRVWRTILLGPIVFALLVAFWIVGLALADTYGSSSALLMVSVSVIAGMLITLTVMSLRRRTSSRKSPSKQDIQTGIRSRRLRPDIYVEVVSSVNENEIGKIFAIDRPSMSLGKHAKDDIRIRDPKIDKEHCILFYSQADSCYYLENLSNKPTVVHDRALERGDISLVENGDLIVLGDSAVLQFRSIF